MDNTKTEDLQQYKLWYNDNT